MYKVIVNEDCRDHDVPVANAIGSIVATFTSLVVIEKMISKVVDVVRDEVVVSRSLKMYIVHSSNIILVVVGISSMSISSSSDVGDRSSFGVQIFVNNN